MSLYDLTEPDLRANSAFARIRLLIVDDSALMRQMIAEIFEQEADFEVVGTARNGEEALQKTLELRPDILTLDVQMPRMDGLTCLKQLMVVRPTRVVMLSVQTTEGAEVTLEALRFGAIDFVSKPSGSISLNLLTRGREIVDVVRRAAQARLVSLHSPSSSEVSLTNTPSLAQFSPLTSQKPTSQRRVVVIAASTGGPAALDTLMPGLDSDLNATYLLIQHLPLGFTKMFAQRLNNLCALEVTEAKPESELKRGCLLVAPAGFHLEISGDGKVVLNENPPLWGVRPAADVVFHSVAARFGGAAIGVVLTGMGRDGASGAKAVKAAGGICIAQDEETSVVYGMPRAAVEAGGIARVLPLQNMADALNTLISTGQLPTTNGGRDALVLPGAPHGNSLFQSLL